MGPADEQRRSGSKRFYRYMSLAEAEAEAVERTGRLRGGRPGETYWTDECFESAHEAKRLLALKVRPEVRMGFRILNAPEFLRDGDRVEPAEEEPGGGREYMSEDAVEVEVIEVESID